MVVPTKKAIFLFDSLDFRGTRACYFRQLRNVEWVRKRTIEDNDVIVDCAKVPLQKPPFHY